MTGENYYRTDGPAFNYCESVDGGKSRILFEGTTFTVDKDFENHPVTFVSWYGAMAFAAHYGWRLPTEWEWQAVADYDGSYTYGCGTEINSKIANYDQLHQSPRNYRGRQIRDIRLWSGGHGGQCRRVDQYFIRSSI